MPPHTITHRVLYAETDQMGIVYNVNYLVWFEAARTELLREAGLPYSEMERGGYYLPVVETGAKFIKIDLNRILCFGKRIYHKMCGVWRNENRNFAAEDNKMLNPA